MLKPKWKITAFYSISILLKCRNRYVVILILYKSELNLSNICSYITYSCALRKKIRRTCRPFYWLNESNLIFLLFTKQQSPRVCFMFWFATGCLCRLSQTPFESSHTFPSDDEKEQKWCKLQMNAASNYLTYWRLLFIGL